MVRSEQLRVCVTPGDEHDIGVIADAWGVPRSTAIYAMVATYLSECRQRRTEMGAPGIVIAASARFLQAYEPPAVAQALPEGS